MYADDLVFTALNVSSLQSLLNNLEYIAGKYGL